MLFTHFKNDNLASDLQRSFCQTFERVWGYRCAYWAHKSDVSELVAKFLNQPNLVFLFKSDETKSPLGQKYNITLVVVLEKHVNSMMVILTDALKIDIGLTLPCRRIQRLYRACLQSLEGRPRSSFPVVALITSSPWSPTVQFTLKLGAFPGWRASALLIPLKQKEIKLQVGVCW